MQRYWSRKLSHVLGRIATTEVCSVPLKEKTTTTPKTVIIKDLTFDDKGLHLSILFSLFKTASQRICNETKNTMGKKRNLYYPVLKYILCILNNYYLKLILDDVLSV